ncbi:MAG TPA: beta-L-arabinofuranosidase domain-containing protein [Phycisphaerae bacterium]|nr:beta-L-arabinofuranosidase domain-containing protein [Phycisphaerae bacterium]
MNRTTIRVLIATFFAALSVAASSASAAEQDLKISVSAAPSTERGNDFHVGNRRPLLPSPLIKLPVGAVKPRGWVRQQLVLKADGMIGHLPKLSNWCRFEGSAWADPNGVGEHGWEELPYWLKGYVSLGAILNDKRILEESRRWLEATIISQREDGYFGPQVNKNNHDLWPNMPMLHAVRTWYEITRDKRILDFMSRYFRWQTTVPLEHYLSKSWQHTRAGDNLESVYWLYNHTGEPWLLDLAQVNHNAAAHWMARIASFHGVNFAQCFREPGIYWPHSGDIRYLKAAERNYDEYYAEFGQMPGGMFAADENARKGYIYPRNGAETCAHVEFMHSAELLLASTGNITWADRCEDVAFNTLPPSMTPDLKALHYITCPNQVQLDRADKAPMIQNEGDMFSYSPYEHYRCCQHNVAFGWPYFAERLWMASAGNGLAAVFYADCAVKAKVGDGTEVTIEQSTDYPFGDTITIKVAPAKAVRFPLSLRIPGWCDNPKIQLNGKPVEAAAKPAQWVTVERIWQSGDTVELQLPMQIRLRTWAANANSVSVDRGPLTYSLKIGEKWRSYLPVHDKDKKARPEDLQPRLENWPCWEVFPTTSWNYALIVDANAPAASFEVVEADRPIEPQPFTPDAAPISLKARGRKIPGWTLEANGLIGMQPQSPVPADKLDAQAEDITLIPMGCARLRVAVFPVAQP